MDLSSFKSVLLHRPRILWLVLGAMLLVSVLPLALYHRQVLQLSQGKLTDTESVQQTEVTRSLAEEIQQFDANLYQQLISERQILALTGLIDKVDNAQNAPQVSRVLENFVASNPNILYLTAVGKDAKGSGAGNFQANQDPFVAKALQRAFTTTLQSLVFRSDPLAIGPENRPAFVMAVPLRSERSIFGDAGRRRFAGRNSPAASGNQRARPRRVRGGPQRAHRGPPGHAPVRARLGRETKFARRHPSHCAAEGTAHDRNASPLRNDGQRQESRKWSERTAPSRT